MNLLREMCDAWRYDRRMGRLPALVNWAFGILLVIIWLTVIALLVLLGSR